MKSFRGVAHYPEYWPSDRYAQDLAMMKEAGLTAIRIGEFAWSSLEPSEDRFTTDWLVEFVRQAGETGIGIIMCTPSACPPQWLTTRYPDTRLIRPDGLMFNSYVRKHYCVNSPTYRDRVRKTNLAIAAAVAPFQNVIGWQIDNELGPHECGRCFCPTCAKLFRQWLRAAYGSIEQLNHAWRTAYWSQHITNWDEIELPASRSEPSLSLDFARFYHDSVVEFYNGQRTTLRQAGVTLPITTNFMGPVYEGLDYWRFSQQVDVAAYDNYMQDMNDASVAIGLDIYRNMRRDFFWLTETGPIGNRGAKPEQSDVRMWFYQTFARGSRGHVFFQWRTLLSGGEQNQPPMLTHSGKPTAGYRQAKLLHQELTPLAEQLDKVPLPRARVALVMDWQAILAASYPSQFISGGITEIQKHLIAIYTYFLRRGINVDVIGPERPLSEYRLVVLCGLGTVLKSETLAGELSKLVKSGGTVLATATTFSKDAFNNYYMQDRPDGLTEIFGLTIGETRQVYASDGNNYVWDRPVALPKLTLTNQPGREFQSHMWIEELLPTNAQTLGSFGTGPMAGQPAVTINSFGAGSAIYVATVAQADLLESLLDRTCRQTGLERAVLPDSVQHIDCGGHHFFLNSSDQPRTVPDAPAGKILVGTCSGGTVQLEPYGVCWIDSTPVVK